MAAAATDLQSDGAEALDPNRQIIELIRKKDAKVLAEFLISSQVKKIDLSRSQTSQIDLEEFKIFAEVLATNNTIETLSFFCSNLGAEKGRLLAQALLKNSTLQSLNLNNCNLRESGPDFATVIATNKTLQVLDLSENNFTQHICIAIMNELANNTSMTDFYFTENDPGIKGIGFAIAYAITKNKFLKSLYLQDNTLTSDDLACIARALKENKTLEFLILRRNSLSMKCLEAFAEMLKHNITLLYIMFDYTSAEEGLGPKIKTILELIEARLQRNGEIFQRKQALLTSANLDKAAGSGVGVKDMVTKEPSSAAADFEPASAKRPKQDKPDGN